MYQGEDLILVTGAPGSRWSGFCRALSAHPNINLSDHKTEYNYSKIINTDTGLKKFSSHIGAYWGPYHDQGHNFDRLDQMSKDTVVQEFKKPFRNWEYGYKIIKSHWFSYHLPILRDMFPKAIIIGIHVSDTECFKWWHKVGGWNISYPHYDWYQDDNKLLKQISIENKNIKKYFNNLKQYNTLTEVLDDLNFDHSLIDENSYRNIDPCFFDSWINGKHYLDLINGIIKVSKIVGIDNNG